MRARSPADKTFRQLFNSRTCQVVLGAGAMRSAGLKNITAKHLALASQSLSAVIAIIPYLREALRPHLAGKQAGCLVEFDGVKLDYREHQQEIHAKLVAIMEDRLALHRRTLRAIDSFADVAPTSVSPYMEAIVKEVSTLHKVLAKYLPGPTVGTIIGRAKDDIAAAMRADFTELIRTRPAATAQLLADVRYLRSRLGALDGVAFAAVRPAMHLQRAGFREPSTHECLRAGHRGAACGRPRPPYSYRARGALARGGVRRLVGHRGRRSRIVTGGTWRRIGQFSSRALTTCRPLYRYLVSAEPGSAGDQQSTS